MIPLIIALIALAGICNAIMDITKVKSIWDKSIWKDNTGWWYKWAGPNSWKNKWKNGDSKQGEKFWGSSRWFVLFTDAWHFFQFMWSNIFIVAILVYSAPFWTWWGAPLIVCYIIDFFILKIVYTTVFTIFYDHIFKAND